MISIDDQDDISTLEDPTVYTRDTHTTRDSVLGTTFLDHDDDEVPSQRTKGMTDPSSLLMGPQFASAASVTDSLANESKLGGQTTASRMTTDSSVIGINFLSDMEEPSVSQPIGKKTLSGAPQPHADDDDDDVSAAWKPGAKWFGTK